jgi:hypothetical protein
VIRRQCAPIEGIDLIAESRRNLDRGSLIRDTRAAAATSTPSARHTPVELERAAVAIGREAGCPATFTCVPPGSGTRIGVDRDGGDVWDGDERDARTDPADPISRP